MTLAVLLLVVAMLVSLVIVSMVLGVIVYHMRKSVNSMLNSNITAHKGPPIDELNNMHTTCAIALIYSVCTCMHLCYRKFASVCTCSIHAFMYNEQVWLWNGSVSTHLKYHFLWSWRTYMYVNSINPVLTNCSLRYKIVLIFDSVL